MQIKLLKYHFIPICPEKINRKLDNSRCWWIFNSIGTLMLWHCFGECGLVEPFWTAIWHTWQSSQLYVFLQFSPAFLLQGSQFPPIFSIKFTEDIYEGGPYCTIYGNGKLEATWLSIIRGRIRKNGILTGILCKYQKWKLCTFTHNNTS